MTSYRILNAPREEVEGVRWTNYTQLDTLNLEMGVKDPASPVASKLLKAFDPANYDREWELVNLGDGKPVYLFFTSTPEHFETREVLEPGMAVNSTLDKCRLPLYLWSPAGACSIYPGLFTK